MNKEQIIYELPNWKRGFSLNTKQPGEALELLSSLENNSTSLIFFDPQYEPVKNVLPTNYPLYSCCLLKQHRRYKYLSQLISNIKNIRAN